MNQYQCILVKNGFQQENFFRDAENANECLESLQRFEYEAGDWKIYLDDELKITGSS